MFRRRARVPAKRLSVRKIKEVLRLHHERGLSPRQIAKSCGIGRTTVSEYLSRAKAAGLGWPLSPDLDHRSLEDRLFPPTPTRTGRGSFGKVGEGVPGGASKRG
jgi:hypothetical protein